MVTRYAKRTPEEGRVFISEAYAPETGAQFLRAAIEGTTALVREIRALPILDRTDHH